MLEMIDRDLAVMPLVLRDAILVDALQLTPVRHVAGLDLPDPQRFIEIEGIRHLRLVVADVARGLMVTNQSYALRTRVVRH